MGLPGLHTQTLLPTRVSSAHTHTHTHTLTRALDDPTQYSPEALTGHGVPENSPHHPSPQLGLVVPGDLPHPGKKDKRIQVTWKPHSLCSSRGSGLAEAHGG